MVEGTGKRQTCYLWKNSSIHYFRISLVDKIKKKTIWHKRKRKTVWHKRKRKMTCPEILIVKESIGGGATEET